VRPDPARPPALARGAYLVNGPGHCVECHSPRNALGGIVASQRFAGGPDPDPKGEDAWVPNITQKGLADWSAKDIAYMLETGDTPEGDSVGGAMAQVVKNTAQLSADDRAAIAAYVKSLPPVEGPPKPPKKESK
jgi:mono/diheme cytochrome c family protein